jgi:UDP-N-acetylmuramoyl-L-alanyl-D-glutamate--2,6-diaminopimelate ligase
MLLSELLTTLTYTVVAGNLDLPVVNVTFDSRKITTGSVFVARKGETVDGHQFIEQAVNKGAVAVVGETFTEAQLAMRANHKVTFIQVEDSAHDGGIIAAAFYGFPSTTV